MLISSWAISTIQQFCPLRRTMLFMITRSRLFYPHFIQNRFLCAHPLAMREQWAKRMSELVRPGGYLVCLAFPLDDHEGGPPFALCIDTYHQLLQSSFELLSDEACTQSPPPRAGKERILVWKRR